jgi:LPS-assembly protein
LPGQAVGTATRSNYIASLVLTPNPDWSLYGDMQYDPEAGLTEAGNVRLQHHPGPGRVINLEYRFTRDQLRTQGASVAWRINPRWQIYAGSIYDLRNEHRLQNFAGLGYESCCWGLRLVWGERFDTLVNATPRYEHAVYLEFVLKGLSSVGSGKDIDTLLKNGILGNSQ